MSILKTKCPRLSDLSTSLGPMNSMESKMSTKPLCDNIFDVQRSELVEVLERLRRAFWSDEVTMPTLTPAPTTIPEPPSQTQPLVLLPPPQTPQPQTPRTPQSYKRIFSEPDEDASYQNSESKPIAKKRMRLNTPQVEEEPIPKKSPITPPTPKSLYSFTSLWPLKKSLIRQIKTAGGYNESQILAVLTDIYQTKSTEQCRHLAIYLIPLAKAMRRENIVKALEPWL